MSRARAVPLVALAATALLGAALALVVAWAAGAFDSDAAAQSPATVEGAPVAGAVSWADLYARNIGGVVTVLVDQGTDGVLTSGAGFVVDARNGYVVTNSHVVTNSSEKGVTPDKVRPYGGFFLQRADKARVPASIVGWDVFDDIAVLHYNPDQLSMSAVQLGSSSALRVGDPVAAIGAPFQQVESLSVGVISQIHTQIPAPAGVCFRTIDGIQTDAAVNPGNSGGPLFDAGGRVVGVTSQIDTNNPVAAGSGVAFAVPVNAIKRSLAMLLGPSHAVRYAFLGVGGVTLTPDVVRSFGLKTSYGVELTFVRPGTDAARAGLSKGTTESAVNGRQLPYGADVITAFNGKPVRTILDLQHDVALLKPGDRVHLTWYHAGKTRRTGTVTLGLRSPTDADVCAASAGP